MITAFSLQTLVDISRHATLGPCLTHLIIGLDYYKGIENQFALTLDDYQQFQDASDAQELLLDTGRALQLLTTALINLPNLNSIDIRNFNSRTRYRDFYHSENSNNICPAWKSYGYSEIPQWTSHLSFPNRSLTGNDGIGCSVFVNRVFRVILTALAESASPLRSLEVLIRSSHQLHVMALTGGGFAVHPILDDGTPTNLPSVLSRLTKVHLDVNLGLESLPSIGPYRAPIQDARDMPECATEVSDPASTNLRKFLALTKNITWLRLNNRDYSLGSAVRFMSWLALNPEKPFGPNAEAHWCSSNPAPVSLPLRRLDLGNMRLNSNTLELLFKKFDKLECVFFREIHLHPVTVPRDEVADGQQNASVWATFFRNLPTVASNLKRIHLSNLSESLEPQTVQPNPVVFYPTMTGPVHMYKYAIELSDVKKGALETLADNTWVKRVWLEVQHGKRLLSDTDDEVTEDEDDSLVDLEHVGDFDE